MSTLKTNNIEHLDASTPSIQTTIGGGTILAGVSTVSGELNVGSNITLNTDGSATFAGGVQVSDLVPGATDNSSGMRLNASGSIQLGRSGTDTLFAGYNTSSSGGSIAATSTIKNDGYAAFGGTNTQFFANGEVQLAANKINIQPDGSASFASSGSVAAVTGKVSTNNGGYNCFRGVNSSDAEVFYVSHNGRVGATDGIIFGSDTAAANVLDDYEEGTHVPALSPTTGTLGSITYSGDTGGKYIKIGSIVHFWGTIRWTAYNTGTGSGSIQVSMPFANVARTSGDDADNAGPAYTPVWGGTSNKIPTTVFGIQNQNKLGFRAGSNDVAATAVQVSQVGPTGMVNFSITYQTSA